MTIVKVVTAAGTVSNTQIKQRTPCGRANKYSWFADTGMLDLTLTPPKYHALSLRL